MIGVLLRISRLMLRRDRVAQMMAFVLPIGFFSIFASIFGRPQLAATTRFEIAIVDQDRSAMSTGLVEALKLDPSLRVRDSVAVGRGTAFVGIRPAEGGARVLLDRPGAERLVREGGVQVAVILPHGWGDTFPSFSGGTMKSEVLADPSDPVARHMIIGILQRAGARVMRGALSDGATPKNLVSEEVMIVPAEVHDVLGDNRIGRRMVAYYAAGVAVMFLLFSASAGGGALLDEQESGTLERVLGTRVGMSGLLAGKWIHVTLVGIAQITIMFVWAMAVFHLDLLSHLPGFALMTVFTAAAAAGFGLVLATLSRTRQQLSGLSTLLILSMSALGGSMFPRFLMSEGMQKVGLATFNAWALDGYLKVFWREMPVASLLPQLAVLALMSAVFLTLARLFARRWEVA